MQYPDQVVVSPGWPILGLTLALRLLLSGHLDFPKGMGFHSVSQEGKSTLWKIIEEVLAWHERWWDVRDVK